MSVISRLTEYSEGIAGYSHRVISQLLEQTGVSGGRILSAMSDDTCTGQWLCDQLCNSPDAVGEGDDVPRSTVMMLDCRSAEEYSAAHVVGSLPVVLPSIMLRRLRNGSASVAAVLSDPSARMWFTGRYRTSHIVLYDASGDAFGSHDVGGGRGDSVVEVLMNRLKKDGCRVSYLLGMCRRCSRRHRSLVSICHKFVVISEIDFSKRSN